MAAQPSIKKNRSAMKRARQAEAMKLKNRSVKSRLKTLNRNVEKEAASKNSDNAQAALKEAISATDKAARKGLIHKNTASRRISRLTRIVNSTLLSEAT